MIVKKPERNQTGLKLRRMLRRRVMLWSYVLSDRVRHGMPNSIDKCHPQSPPPARQRDHRPGLGKDVSREQRARHQASLL